MTQKLEDKIIKTIKEKNIRPLPRWIFLAENYFLWSAFIFSLIIGGLSWAAIFYLIKSDWYVYNNWQGSFVEYMLKILPFFWFLVLIFLSFVAWYNFKHTKKGYKYHFSWVIILNIVISGILGGGLYALGMGEFIDNQLAKNIPLYNDYINQHRLEIWLNPENGTLAGKIVKTKQNSFTLKDFYGHFWDVDFSKATKHGKIKISGGEEIKILGEKKDDHSFVAKQIYPWGKGRLYRQLHNERKNF